MGIEYVLLIHGAAAERNGTKGIPFSGYSIPFATERGKRSYKDYGMITIVFEELKPKNQLVIPLTMTLD